MYLKFPPLLLALCGPILLLAQNSAPLFNITAAETSPIEDQLYYHAQLQAFDTEQLINIPRSLKFPISDTSEVEITLEEKPGPFFEDLRQWEGLAPDPRFAHLDHYRNVIITVNPRTNKLYALVQIEDGLFELRSDNESDAYTLVHHLDGDFRCRTLTPDLPFTPTEPGLRISCASNCNETDENGVFVADVFMGYSDLAASVVGDLNAHALSMIATVNQGLNNSLIGDIYLRLVGTGTTPNNPGIVTSVLGDCLNWFAAEIDQTAADYIGVWQTPTGAPNEAGGWAGIGGFTNVNSVYSPNAYRHEVGHNCGGGHCPGDGGINGLSYAHGFNNGNWRTFLCGNSNNFYSTPLVNDDMGNPLGSATDADMARLWGERAEVISNRLLHRIPFGPQDNCANLHCNPDHWGSQNDMINRVQINTIDNATNAWLCDDIIGYSDYTSISTMLNIGNNYPLIVSPNYGWEDSKIGVWIDWNTNGWFEGNEQIPGNNVAPPWNSTNPWTATVTPPTGTTLGPKRMRIRLQYGPGYIPHPCNGSGWSSGETEDYTIVVNADPSPVELTDFTAACEGNHVILRWTTAAEIQNRGFEIMASPDARNWSNIGWSPSATPDSQTPTNYRFKSTDLGMRYFRLRQIDMDGTASMSPVAFVDCEEDRAAVQIFPNPAKDVLNVQFSDALEQYATLQLLTVDGQVLQTHTSSDQVNTLDLSSLAPGIYLVTIQHQNERIVKRIVRY